MRPAAFSTFTTFVKNRAPIVQGAGTIFCLTGTTFVHMVPA